jgi:hypothetical protein
MHLRIVDQLQDGLGIHERHRYGSIRLFAHDHVARQQQADVGVSLDRAVGEWGIARTEYPVRPALDIELGLERRLDVDVGEDAESFRFQGRGDFRDGGVEWTLSRAESPCFDSCFAASNHATRQGPAAIRWKASYLYATIPATSRVVCTMAHPASPACTVEYPALARR